MSDASRSKQERGEIESLANTLAELGYRALFQSADPQAAREILDDSHALKTLEVLVNDPSVPQRPRFLAAELLSSRQKRDLTFDQRRRLAAVYAAALAGNFTLTANPWGLPGIFLGLVGNHMIALGEAAIPDLIRLLDNPTALHYVGSEQSTLGSLYGVRVKDLAAHYLSAITGIPFDMAEDSRQRDKSIADLKRKAA